MIQDTTISRTKVFENTGIYWTNQSTSIGTGVAIETKGYKTLIVAITSVISAGGVSGIDTKAIFKGNNSAIFDICQFLDENGNRVNIPRDGRVKLTTGTTILKTDVSKMSSIGFGLAITSGTASVSISYQLTGEDITSNFPTKHFYTHLETSKFKIEVNNNFNLKLGAIYRDIVAYVNWYSENILYISTKGRTDNPTSITYNNTNFPNLIAGSTIAHVIIMPWDRRTTSTAIIKGWRMAVISTKGQIHHNYPTRANDGTDGTALSGDELLFDESVVWDLPTRRFPSKTVDSTVYQLNPYLPDAAYTLYPPISTDNGYGNGGFGDLITVNDEAAVSHTYPRFYIHNRTVLGSDGAYSNPFKYMGGMEYSDKICMLGTYAPNLNGCAYRIVVIASTDGGRSWFCKYEFGDTTPSSGLGAPNTNAWGNPINGSVIATSWTGGSVYATKRTPNTPTLGNEEPAVPFTHGTDIEISSISRTSPLTVNTVGSHGYVTGELIYLHGTPLNSDFAPLFNNTATPTNIGTGMFFKVNVITATQFTLYEMIHNPANNIFCRHIHHINRVKDGFTIGCGEQHPQGWMFYVPIQLADGVAVLKANYTMNFIRLNSTPGALQRSLGFILKDDVDSTIIFGSDNEFTVRDNKTIPNRTVAIPRNSCGVFKGKLSQIDDMDNFNCILQMPQVAYFFKEKLGAWIAIGDMGYMAISFDEGNTWTEVQLPVELYGSSRFLGTSFKREIGIQGMIITLK